MRRGSAVAEVADIREGGSSFFLLLFSYRERKRNGGGWRGEDERVRSGLGATSATGATELGWE